MIKINIGVGYGGFPKITAEAEGKKLVIERDYLESFLVDLIESRGFTVEKTKLQKIGRLIINK